MIQFLLGHQDFEHVVKTVKRIQHNLDDVSEGAHHFGANTMHHLRQNGQLPDGAHLAEDPVVRN